MILTRFHNAAVRKAIAAACVVGALGVVGACSRGEPGGAADSHAAAPSAADGVARLSDGHPDFNGSWDNGSGYDFLKPQTSADGSICLTNCTPPANGTAALGSAPASGPAPAAGRAPAGGAAPGAPARAAPDRPKYKPEFVAKVKNLEQRQVEFDPVLRCKSPGLPRIGPPDKIVQREKEIVFIYDDVSGSFWRIIPTDGSKHREDVDESYLGNAVGRWEGDALVVETIGFNDDTWLTDDGAFHTRDLRVVERLTRDGDTMEWQATAYDPEVLAEPWAVRPRKMTLMAAQLQEPVPCVEQDLKHVVDGTHHDNPR